MKLGEALSLRSSTQTEIAELRKRIASNLIVDDGEKPTENPADLFQELSKKSEDLRDLVKRINSTNATAKLSNGMTIMEAIAERDYLGSLYVSAKGIQDNSKEDRDHYSYSRPKKDEVKRVTVLDVKQYIKMANEFAAQRRALDALLQEANWTTEVV